MGPRFWRDHLGLDPMSLTRAPTGQPFVVVGFSGGRRFLHQIMGMGIMRGSEVTVVRRNGAGGSMLVAVGEGRIVLGRGMAHKVLVKAAGSIDGPVEGPEKTKTLFDLVSGDRARILRIRGGGSNSIRQRLLDMGVMRGTEVEVERHAPLGDPVEVAVKGYHLALRMNEAREIEVEDI